VCVFASSAIALGVASLVCTLLSLRGLAVRRGPAGAAAAGQLLSLPLVVTNLLNRRRQTFIIREHCPFAAVPDVFTLVDALGPREERVVSRRILTRRRGGFQQRQIILRGGDPAGLFSRERTVVLPQSLVITPATEPLSDIPWRPRPARIATVGSPLSMAGTSQELYGIREHRAADGLRNIHWKSSARFGRLMVREFERDAVMSVALLIDADAAHLGGPDDDSNLEYLVRAAASLVEHLAGLYCQVALAAGGARQRVIPPAPAAPAKPVLLYELAMLKAGPLPLATAALELAGKLPRDGAVICLSLSPDAALAGALEFLASQGMAVRWFCAEPEAFWKPAARRRPPAVVPSPPRFDIVSLRPESSLAGVLCHGA